MDKEKIFGIFVIVVFGIAFFVSITAFILSLFASMIVLSIISGITSLVLYLSRNKVTKSIRKLIRK